MSRYASGGPEPRVQSTVSRREPYDGGRDRYRDRGDRERSRDPDDRGDNRRRRQRDDRDDDLDRCLRRLECTVEIIEVMPFGRVVTQ